MSSGLSLAFMVIGLLAVVFALVVVWRRTATTPRPQLATARRLVEQKMAGTRGQPPEARARRAAGTLARKGYPPGLIFRLIKEVLEQEDSPEAFELDPDQYLDPDEIGG